MLSACPAVVDFICHLLTNSRQFEKLLFAGGVFGGFRQVAGTWPPALGGNLSSAASDNIPLENQADPRYFALRDRSSRLCEYHSIVSLSAGTALTR